MHFRQVHLDFHTSECIEGIGSKFDKKQFQEALIKGHINSITLFSKCHHGWSYHPTKANEQHPNLDFDLLGAQIEAAHEIGVRTPVYLSAGLDEKVLHEHPEWLVRKRDESTTWVNGFDKPGFHKGCMNTPYLEYLALQVEEVCKNYDADEIFLDITIIQPCYCRNCIEGRIAKGVDPFDEAETYKYAVETHMKYVSRMRKAIDKYKPGLPVYHNSGGYTYPGRYNLMFANSHFELECLPTAGLDYFEFPNSAKYFKNFDRDCISMTGKFHTSWGEFGGFKHPNALRYEASVAVALGCGVSVGDQLAPNGAMDMVTYEMIGKAYKEVEKAEPWLSDVKPVSDIGCLFTGAFETESKAAQYAHVGSVDKGLTRILLEGKYLYDNIDVNMDFGKYKVIVLPDVIRIDDELKKKLDEYVKCGGKILATGKSGLSKFADEFVLDLGAKWISENPYCPDYVRPTQEIAGMGNTAYVMYNRGEKIEATGNTLAIREDTYFNRAWNHFCSHAHTPPSGVSGGAAITEGGDGIYISWQVFNEYGEVGSLHLKQMVHFALDRLLGDSKTIVSDLPVPGIVTLMKQDDRLVNHLVYASPVKRGMGIEVIEDIVPIYNSSVSLKVSEKPSRVYLAPQRTELDYTYENGRINYTVPKIDCHQMVVIE